MATWAVRGAGVRQELLRAASGQWPGLSGCEKRLLGRKRAKCVPHAVRNEPRFTVCWQAAWQTALRLAARRRGFGLRRNAGVGHTDALASCGEGRKESAKVRVERGWQAGAQPWLLGVEHAPSLRPRTTLPPSPARQLPPLRRRSARLPTVTDPAGPRRHRRTRARKRVQSGPQACLRARQVRRHKPRREAMRPRSPGRVLVTHGLPRRGRPRPPPAGMPRKSAAAAAAALWWEREEKRRYEC